MRAHLVALAVGLALLASVPSSAMASQPAHGYVTYNVALTGPQGSKSFVVNETVQPSSKVGYSDLVLQLVGHEQNLTYSRLVNSSMALFPSLAALANQSISYAGKGYGFGLNMTESGSESVSFQGGSYQVASYGFTYSVASSNHTFEGNGTVAVFPSGLLYSASVRPGGHVTLTAVLAATDLSLTAPAARSSPATYAVAAGGVGVAALVVVPLLARRGRREAGQAQEERPLHWVD